MRKIMRLVIAVSRIAITGAGLLVVAMMALVLYGIGARQLGITVAGTVEASGMLLMAIVFLSLAHTFVTDGHIRTGLVLSRLRPGTRRVFEVLAGVVALVWSLAIFIAVTQRTYSLYLSGSQDRNEMIELWIPASTMVLGAGLLLIQVLSWLIMQFFPTLRSLPEEERARLGDEQTDAIEGV